MMIKASFCNPTIFNLYRRRMVFSNRLFQSGFSFPVSRFHHTVGIKTSRPAPINNKIMTNVPDITTPSITKNARSLGFQCRCSKEENLVVTKTRSDSGLWKQWAPKLQTHWFMWMLLILFICMIFLGPIKDAMSGISKLTPKWVLVVSLPLILMVTTFRGSNKNKPRNVSFEDLVGVDAAKAEMQKILYILQKKSAYKKFDALLPDGVLLYGPERTGKTTLAHALAHEAKVPFFGVDAEDISRLSREKAIGEIKNLFIEARKYSRSIIYIEYVDAIARKHESGESDPALIRLYSEMKRCKKDEIKVIVIAATNRPERLDPSLMTSRLFSTKVRVDKPNEDCKRKMVNLLLGEFVREEEDKEAICNLIVSQTPGSVWDDLKNVCNASILFANCRGDDPETMTYVTTDDVLEALKMVKPTIKDD